MEKHRAKAAAAEAGPGSPEADVAQEAESEPTQAAPPHVYAYYCMSALAEIDPEDTIKHLITVLSSQEAQGLELEDFGDESKIAQAQSGLSGRSGD